MGSTPATPKASRAAPRSLLLARAATLALAAGLSWGGAMLAAHQVEARSQDAVADALRLAGYDWASVGTDGLQVQLSGTAPSEAQRVKALTVAGGVVDAGRLVDQMEVAQSAQIEAPVFSIEVLRNDGGIQLIGLIPASTDRAALVEQARAAAGGRAVTDLLESADYPAPDHWDRAVGFAMTSLQAMPRAKVTIRADQVAITAITDSASEKAQLETDLARRKPDAISLVTDISAPRPVIAPFTMRFLIDEQGPHFDACAADTEAARDRILQAAAEAGVKGTPGCTVGLGAPSAEWGQAVTLAIAALSKLGSGSVTFSDGDVALIAAETVAAADFDAAVGQLESNLPRGFSLTAERLKPAEGADQAPRLFSARLTPEGGIALSGQVVDDRQRDAIEAYARARFGSDKVDLALKSDADLPQGWAIRVIAALEALGTLSDGQVEVTPDLLRVTGESGDAKASDTVAGLLSDRLAPGAPYELRIAYDRRLDPTLGLPSGDECVDDLNNILGRSEFSFAPNKTALDGDPAPTIAAIGQRMADCADFRMEIGGHTDSQGSEGFNQTLSEGRAKSVLTALAEANIPTAHLTARGYGESQPIASNDTEEGRDTNRRIEFRLLDDAPIDRGTEAAAPVEVVTGTTAEPPAETDADRPAEDAAQGGAGDTAEGAADGADIAAPTPSGSTNAQSAAPADQSEGPAAEGGTAAGTADGTDDLPQDDSATTDQPAAATNVPPAVANGTPQPLAPAQGSDGAITPPPAIQAAPGSTPASDADSFTADGVTVPILPVTDDTRRPAPRPDR
ncbi:OmpA family protein [Paracoccus sp. p4-l81]|uniref:OmpA family protein n=1 Tax=Paracoccus sp. p4-l81 TaxID=3342806 RepID=UPI0035B985EE